MCSAGGLSGLLGATKRRILSFADRPPSVEVVGAPFEAGTAEGIAGDVDNSEVKKGDIICLEHQSVIEIAADFDSLVGFWSLS